MSGFPNIIRYEPSSAPLVAGAPVSSLLTWHPAAAGTNWLNGTGAQLIPAAAIVLSKSSTTTNVQFRFRTYTRAQAIERIWAIQLQSTTTTGAAGTINVNSYGDMNVDVPAVGIVNAPFLYREVLSSQAAARTDHIVKVSSTGGKSVQVMSISCWEQWRTYLAESSNDNGVNEQSIRPRERVYVGNYPTTADSATAVYDAMLAADARRSGLFHFGVPDTNAAARSGAYQSVLGLPAPILTRKLTSGQTTGTVYWSAYAKVSGGSGDIKVTTTHSGVSDSVNITNTSYAWTTPRAISVDCEDLSAGDGRQSSTWDELDVLIQGNGGQTLSLVACSVYEAP